MTETLTRLNRKDLVDKLIPDYPVGCKRIAYSAKYLEGLARENVIVERSSIMQVKNNSIVTENGEEHEFDVLILATGFITQDYMGPLQGTLLCKWDYTLIHYLMIKYLLIV